MLWLFVRHRLTPSRQTFGAESLSVGILDKLQSAVEVHCHKDE